jgi:aldose 1-epimerase
MTATVAPSGRQWVIGSGDHEAVITEVGAGVRQYRYQGRDYLDGYGEGELAPSGAGQILAPWPNRIRDGRYTVEGRQLSLPLNEPDVHNAIHGLVRWLPWEAEQTAPTRCGCPAGWRRSRGTRGRWS